MAKKILENIKIQIERQNLAPLNTNIQEAPVIGVGKSSGKVPIGKSNQINPRWIRGSYNLNRGTGITVDDFINYSGKINWEIIDGRTVSIQGLGRNSNNLFGIQLFSTTNFNLDLDLVTRLGSLKVFVKSESDGSFRSVFSKDGFFNGSIKIPIKAHQWNTVILTFYAADETSSVYFASDYNNILGWRFLDVQSPDIPTWHSVPLVNSIVRTPEIKDKITLQWSKDSSIGFGGNGIYKKSVIDSGYTVDNTIPGTYLQEENFFINRLPNEEVKWLSYFGTIATLNAGDKISFNSDGENTYEVSQLFRNPKNNIRNPVFQNSGAHWNITDLIEKSDLNARISKSYYNLNTIATNSKFSIVSTLFSISGSIYVMGIYAEQDELLKRPYGLDGYGSTPSRWTSTGSIDSITATRRDSVPYVEVVRSGAGNFRISDNPLYFSTSATYYLYTTASFPDLESFKVVFNLYTGATIFTSGSLYSSYGKYNAHRVVFTPSITGTGHLKIIVPSTLGSTSFSTLYFGQFKLERIYRQQDVNEYIQTQFLKSDKSPCATPLATLNITTGIGLSNNIITFGTNPSLNFNIPSDCSFIKLGYVASINNTSIPINFNRNIYGMYAQEGSTFRGLSLFATQSVYLRAASTLSYTVGSQIFFEKFQHIIDRPAQADDGAVVTWDDFDIEDNTQYKYYLDAYDTSSFLNRSSLSTIATLTSGDITPPKVPTSYVLTGLEGGLKHTWVNPTATDFKSVKCYSNIDLTTIVFDKSGTSNEADLYSEFTTGTALASRYLVAFDVFGNSSAAAFATATPLPSKPPQINFSINFITAAGSRVEVNENGWYNRNQVIASFVVDSNIAVASYLFSFFTPSISEQWGNWLNSSGRVTYNEVTNHKHYTRHKIRDIYGNYSDIIQHQIFMDTVPPGFHSEKKTFWNHNITGGYNGYNILSWNDTFDNISKYQSPVLKAVIERAEVTSLISNPAFEENITVSSTGTLRNTDWVLQTSGATIYINPNDSSEGSHSLSFKTTAGAATRLVITSPETSINRDGNYYGIIKYKAVPSGANIASISFYLDGAGDTAKAEVESVVTSTHWQELKWNYTNTGATFTANLVLYMRNSTSGDEVIIDEVSFVSNPIFSTIAEIDSRTTKYVDNGVRPWVRYLYRIRPIDAAGNVGTVSHYKYIRAIPDFRDKFRNILDNSSFERTNFTANGTLRADSWVNWGWNGQFATTHQGDYEVKSSGASHGQNYIIVSSNDRAYQNDIHVLPFIGQTKRYVISSKVKSLTGVSGFSAVINIAAKDKERNIIKSKTITKTILPDSDWISFTATFSYSSPSINHFDFLLLSSTTSKITCFDEIQLEEKNSLPPTDYYDGVVVRADHIQGNLIRANMLEANVIYADHINVNQINATHIKANTITAAQIKADTITTTEMKLADADVFLKSQDIVHIGCSGNIEYPFHETIYGRINLANVGLTNFGVVFNIAGVSHNNRIDDYGRTTTGTVFCGRITDTFDRDTFNIYSKFGGNLGTAQHVLISRTFPFDSNGYALMVHTKGNNQLYRTYCKLSDSSFAEPAFWSTKVSTGITSVVAFGANKLVYYNNNFFLGVMRNTDDYHIYRLAQQGTIIDSFSPGIAVKSSYFDISSTGTVLSLWSKVNKATIWGRTYTVAGTALGSEFEISTYSGHGIEIMPGIGKGDLSPITGVYVSYATINKYILSYTLTSNNLVYYKIIDGQGNIKANQDIDIPFMKTQASDTYDRHEDSGYSFYQGHMTRSYYQSLFYLSGGIRLNTVGTNLSSQRNFSIGGKCHYFTRMETLLDLEDLFNRLD